jgi:putative endonuclease
VPAGSLPRRQLGSLGEEIAERYLALRGLVVLARNLRVAHKEIDLLARDGDCLVFVEVRLRRGERFGRAVDSVDRRKQAHLRAALREAVARRAWPGSYRLDLITLDLDGARDRLLVEHYRGL